MVQRRSKPAPTFELGGIVQSFLDEYRYSSSGKTLDFYRYHIERALLPFLADRDLRQLIDVTPEVLREFFVVSRQAGTINDTTLSHRYDAVGRFFTWCEENDYLAFSPMRKVKRPAKPNTDRKGFTQAEVQKLVREAGKAGSWLAYRDRAIVLLFIDTGMRASELLGLTPTSFTWGKTPRVRVLGKGRKFRELPLGARAARGVQEYLGAIGKVMPERVTLASNIWLTQRRTIMDYGTLNAMLHNLGKYAGVDQVIPHRFRHTYASAWYAKHRDIEALKNLLGHSKIQTTQEYLRSLGVAYGTGNEYESPGDFLI